MVKHRLISFATVVALCVSWSSCNVANKANSRAFEVKFINGKNYAILAAVMRKQSYFVKSSWLERFHLSVSRTDNSVQNLNAITSALF